MLGRGQVGNAASVGTGHRVLFWAGGEWPFMGSEESKVLKGLAHETLKKGEWTWDLA